MPKSQFTDAYATFVAMFAAARKRAGISQVELGRRVGRDQPFVSLVEKGVRRVDIIEFCALARGIGRDPAELLAEIQKKFPNQIDI